jgi:signal transduction histidine kinase
LIPNLIGRMVWRLIWHIVFSAALAAFTVFAAYALALSLPPQLSWLRAVLKEVYILFRDLFGPSFLFNAGGFAFFVVYMILFQLRRFRYLAEIRTAVAHIAEGNFDDQVPVRQRNELRELAVQTNRLVDRLKRSLDEERRAEQTKNELITNVSHDLRTPLTSILGYLGLIEQDRYRDEVELRYYISIAYEKSQRLNVLINDLFEYTRMRNGAVSLQKIKLNLVEMVGQLLAHHRILLKEAGMEGGVHADEPEIAVMGDPNKLARVFENLISNAIAYGKDGRRIDFFFRRSGREAVVEVVNYGEPIPSTDLPYIFDRFYRVDKSRSEHNGGSGLGLAIVKSLVELHGGRIEAASDASRTVFRVSLPLAAAPDGYGRTVVPS